MSEVEKPTRCATCGGRVEQSGAGQPRVYCDVVCRRAAEYALRRVVTLLSTADKGEQRARMALALPYGKTTDNRKTAKAWRAEVEQLDEQLSRLLAP